MVGKRKGLIRLKVGGREAKRPKGLKGPKGIHSDDSAQMSRINATHDVTAGAYGGDAYYVMITDDFDDGSDSAFAKVSADAFNQCRGIS